MRPPSGRKDNSLGNEVFKAPIVEIPSGISLSTFSSRQPDCVGHHAGGTAKVAIENLLPRFKEKNMKYNKLVRDKIPEYIKSKGGLPITHIAADEEYWQKLKEKLQEEVNEFRKESNAEEVADILEIIDAICEYKGFNKEDLQKTKEKKVEDRGKFKDRIILEES